MTLGRNRPGGRPCPWWLHWYLLSSTQPGRAGIEYWRLGHSYGNIWSFARLADRPCRDQIRRMDWFYHKFDHSIHIDSAKKSKAQNGVPIRAFLYKTRYGLMTSVWSVILLTPQIIGSRFWVLGSKAVTDWYRMCSGALLGSTAFTHWMEQPCRHYGY